MTAAVTFLLVVTEDGYAKRIPVSEIRRTKGRGTQGVKVSSSPVAFSAVVEEDDELVLASERGKIERVAVASIPTRRREVRPGGRLSKGVPVMTLADGDQLAAGAVTRVAEKDVQTAPAADWPAGRVGLLPGERIASADVSGCILSVSEVEPGGEPAVEGSEWAQTEIHALSSYWCVHCGEQHEDPEAVYDCIDRHMRLG
jgi:DNA gyrase/topoisomerase IV subunit A